jgi:hypothetical protein
VHHTYANEKVFPIIVHTPACLHGALVGVGPLCPATWTPLLAFRRGGLARAVNDLKTWQKTWRKRHVGVEIIHDFVPTTAKESIYFTHLVIVGVNYISKSKSNNDEPYEGNFFEEKAHRSWNQQWFLYTVARNQICQTASL